MKIRTNIKKAIILAGITTIAISGTIFAAPDASQEKIMELAVHRKEQKGV